MRKYLKDLWKALIGKSSSGQVDEFVSSLFGEYNYRLCNAIGILADHYTSKNSIPETDYKKMHYLIKELRLDFYKWRKGN